MDLGKHLSISVHIIHMYIICIQDIITMNLIEILDGMDMGAAGDMDVVTAMAQVGDDK
jgi:hypothetical protein